MTALGVPTFPSRFHVAQYRLLQSEWSIVIGRPHPLRRQRQTEQGVVRMDAYQDNYNLVPSNTVPAKAALSPTSVLLPLALAQFIASYAASNMNVAISNIAIDLDTSVRGVQTAITFFTLKMAALLIPISKLAKIWARNRSLTIGLIIYGLSSQIAALTQGRGDIIFG